MPNHTYRHHVSPAMLDQVNTAFEAIANVWEQVCLGGQSDLPRDLINELFDGVCALQVQADESNRPFQAKEASCPESAS